MDQERLEGEQIGAGQTFRLKSGAEFLEPHAQELQQSGFPLLINSVSGNLVNFTLPSGQKICRTLEDFQRAFVRVFSN